MRSMKWICKLCMSNAQDAVKIDPAYSLCCGDAPVVVGTER